MTDNVVMERAELEALIIKSTEKFEEAVEKATGRRAHVLRNVKQAGGVSRLCADISLATRWLNYRPAIGLEAGLRLTTERDSRFAGLATI